MTISKELLDELLSGVERPEDLLCDKGLMKVSVRRHRSAAHRECPIVSALDSGHYGAVDGASNEAALDG